LEDLEDFGDDVEVFLLLRCLLELASVGIGDDIARSKVLSSILLQGASNGTVLLLLGGLLAREGIRVVAYGLAER